MKKIYTEIPKLIYLIIEVDIIQIFIKTFQETDDELFFGGMVDRRKVNSYFQPGPLSEILTNANLQHATSRVWTCAEPEFRLGWMKLCSSDNHYTTVPQLFGGL